MMPVRLEPATLLSGVKHSTTEPLRSLQIIVINKKIVMSKNMDDGLISHSETSEQAEGISKMLWA